MTKSLVIRRLTRPLSPFRNRMKEEEENPRVYIRVHGALKGGYTPFDWFCLRNDVAMTRKRRICKCGAVKDLKRVFARPKYRPESSIAAVGHLIYEFGGMDIGTNYTACAEVSYIDTRCPKEGWKVCQKKMPKARSYAYPITLDNERVLLVGGFDISEGDRTFAQMFNSRTGECVPLESYPDERPHTFVSGHGVVVDEEGKNTMVVMHVSLSDDLYTYDVKSDRWGIRQFKEDYSSGALVDGIYYVIDLVSCPRVVLCGYDISLDCAECLPVKILVDEKNGDKDWVPLADDDGDLPRIQLLWFGGCKLAMVWYDWCPDAMKLSFYTSVFEMKKDATHGGRQLKLVARPLSHVCYHVKADRFNGLVTVFPPKCGPNANLATKLEEEETCLLE